MNPLHLEKSERWRAIGRVRPPRCGGPSARPLGETGYRLLGWFRFPDQTQVVETVGISDRGYLRPGVPELRGLLGWGMLRGMSGGRRWRGRNQKQLRQLVTDVYGWRCSICHTMIDPNGTRLRDRLSIDHVLPVSRGGTDTIENLRPAHYGCNAARGDGSRTVRRRPTEIGIAFFPTGPGREPAPTFRFPPNRLKFGKNGETE